jgi:hypothetical protein
MPAAGIEIISARYPRKMTNDDYKMMLADMCREWIRNTDYAAVRGWSEERAVEAMLQLVERGFAWFECQQVGTMGFETGIHMPMGSA